MQRGPERQVSAIVDGVEEALLTQRRRKPLRREGERDARWVLADHGDIVVHVQHAEDRAFYALERLWRDAPVLDLRIDEGRTEWRPAHRTRPVLVRHGQTDHNREGRLQGQAGRHPP